MNSANFQNRRTAASFVWARWMVIFAAVSLAAAGCSHPSPKARSPLDAEISFANARADFDAGRYDFALTNLNRALEANPSFVEAYMARGWVKLQLHDCRGAVADADRAIALNPKVGGLYSNRGRAKFICGQTKEALADYNRALELDPRCAEALYNRGTLEFVRLTNYANAIADFTKAIELHSDPQEADLYYWRASAEHRLKNYGNAIADYKRSVELNANGPFAQQAREGAISAQMESGGVKK